MKILTALDKKDLYLEIKTFFNKARVYDDIIYYQGVIDYINKLKKIDIIILSETALSQEEIKKILLFIKNNNLKSDIITILREDSIEFREYILSYGFKNIFILNKDKKTKLFKTLFEISKNRISPNSYLNKRNIEEIKEKLIKFHSNKISNNIPNNIINNENLKTELNTPVKTKKYSFLKKTFKFLHKFFKKFLNFFQIKRVYKKRLLKNSLNNSSSNNSIENQEYKLEYSEKIIIKNIVKNINILINNNIDKKLKFLSKNNNLDLSNFNIK